VLTRLEQADADRNLLEEQQLELHEAIDRLVRARAESRPRAAQIRLCSDAIIAARQALRVQAHHMIEDSTSSLSTEKRTRLGAWTDSAGTFLPPELRVVEWSPRQRAALEEAIRSERRAAATGRPLAPASAALLADARSRTEVIEALQWLQTRLEAIEDEFENQE
jgi:hypothetical protein